ncbi:hypothetical protein LX81_01819 [Palleronia aestuarii]|uniref:Uncharacterized protein n=1 Tax=Palleronia aestuarii TaxID=568105 RepID=A0A2W7NG84_9RHOB|nr:hypothetical protein LX81_01819 [Palleronia aestuarii]
MKLFRLRQVRRLVGHVVVSIRPVMHRCIHEPVIKFSVITVGVSVSRKAAGHEVVEWKRIDAVFQKPPHVPVTYPSPQVAPGEGPFTELSNLRRAGFEPVAVGAEAFHGLASDLRRAIARIRAGQGSAVMPL